MNATYSVEGSIKQAHADRVGLIRFTLEPGATAPAPGDRVVLVDPDESTLVATVEQLDGSIVTAIPLVGFAA